MHDKRCYRYLQELSFFFFVASAFRPVWPGRCIFELYLYTAVDSRPGPGGSRTTASCQP